MSKVGLSLTFVKSLCCRNAVISSHLERAGRGNQSKEPAQHNYHVQSLPKQLTATDCFQCPSWEQTLQFSPALPRWWTKVYLKLNLKESRLQYPAVRAPSNPHWGLPRRFIISINWNQQKTATKPSKLREKLLPSRVEVCKRTCFTYSIPSY